MAMAAEEDGLFTWQQRQRRDVVEQFVWFSKCKSFESPTKTITDISLKQRLWSLVFCGMVLCTKSNAQDAGGQWPKFLVTFGKEKAFFIKWYTVWRLFYTLQRMGNVPCVSTEESSLIHTLPGLQLQKKILYAQEGTRWKQYSLTFWGNMCIPLIPLPYGEYEVTASRRLYSYTAPGNKSRYTWSSLINNLDPFCWKEVYLWTERTCWFPLLQVLMISWAKLATLYLASTQ